MTPLPHSKLNSKFFDSLCQRPLHYYYYYHPGASPINHQSFFRYQRPHFLSPIPCLYSLLINKSVTGLLGPLVNGVSTKYYARCIFFLFSINKKKIRLRPNGPLENQIKRQIKMPKFLFLKTTNPLRWIWIYETSRTGFDIVDKIFQFSHPPRLNFARVCQLNQNTIKKSGQSISLTRNPPIIKTKQQKIATGFNERL